ncbi:MAG: GNAT family protein [Rubricoccaceae bacterium]
MREPETDAAIGLSRPAPHPGTIRIVRQLVAPSSMPAPVTLTGSHVRLAPLTLDHLDALAAVGLDPDLWRLSPRQIETRDHMRAYIEEALDEHARGVSLPFATVDLASASVAGCTRFGSIELAHKRLEIGWTWIAKPWQRTAVNTEAKLLMLRYAFETLGCQRVELKTDSRNERSQNAMRRIGATEEGTLRKHMVTASGYIRHTVYFSILDDEWPAVEAHLTDRLAR